LRSPADRARTVGASFLAAALVAVFGLTGVGPAAASSPVDCTGATSPVPAACAEITPTVCVIKNGGQNGVTGYFGYINKSGQTLDFTPDTGYDEVIQVSTGSPHTDLSIPAVYPPGTNTSFFTFSWPGDILQWRLGDPANSIYAAGSNPSGSCPDPSVPQVGNVGVAAGVVVLVLLLVNRRRRLVPLLRARFLENR
jgi:hypothetical protein